MQALFRNRVRLARPERVLRPAELAARAEVTRQTISSMENGQYVPSAKPALVLGKVLGKAVEDLFYLAESV